MQLVSPSFITLLPPLHGPICHRPNFRRNGFASRKDTQLRYFRVMASSVSDANQNRSSMQVNACTQDRSIVINTHNEKLIGVLHGTGSKDAVVLCHGFRSRKENRIMVSLANALTERGFSAFRFDFSGNGESEGQFQYGNYWKEVEDLRSVILYLNRNGKSVVSVIGHSKGGNIVLLYASKYHDVNFVVNVSGRYDLNKGIMERLGEDFMQRIEVDGFIDVKNNYGDYSYRVTKESLMDRLQTDMKSAALSISKNCRVLTVHGSKDEIIPVSDAFEFNKLIPCHTLHVVEGGDHAYTSHLNELISAVLDFLMCN